MHDILNPSSGNRDLCSICTHSPVCKYTEMMKKVQTTVNEVDVVIGSDHNGTIFNKISNIDFIKPVNIECKYFVQNQMIR